MKNRYFSRCNMPFVKLNGHYSNYELQSGLYNLEGSIGYQFAIIFEKMLAKNISLEAGAGISRICSITVYQV